ncbi:MAG TPA: alpha/beta hydrolase [Pseudonocardiaceae bacterium]
MTTLVLLHAFPVDSRMWNPVRSVLAAAGRLADPPAGSPAPGPDALTLVTPDQRGCGRTPLPGDGAEPHVDVVARDVLAHLDSLGVDRAVVGGCSMGGYVAMALARIAPERVAGLLLADTRPDADDADRRAMRLAAAERAEREGTDWLPATVLPGLLAAGSPDTHPELAARLRAVITEQPPAGVAWAQRAMAARPDSADVLRAFDGPALVVVGERDALSPPEQARAMAAMLPAGRYVELPGSGHLAPVESPDEFVAALTTWLRDTHPA